MKRGEKVAIVCCSNGQNIKNKNQIEQLICTLEKIGLIPIVSEYIYAKDSCFSGTAQERAEQLMRFYEDDEIKAIFDVSGGDIANEILPYLDFELIAKSDKKFWGYSDLTTILNAIYTKTGKISVLYQIRNLIYDDSENQIQNFTNTVMKNQSDLHDVEYTFLQGTEMKGILVGGNIRCLLKLAGTEYWPDMNGKILLLEAFGGKAPQMITYLSQLKQLGVFEKIQGIILGTFTAMEQEGVIPHMKELIKDYAGKTTPIAYTKEIGHGVDSKAMVIGQEIEIGLPREIIRHISGQKYSIDEIGMSNSTVMVFEDKVLKIQPETEETKKELIMLEWLAGKLPVPKQICHVSEQGRSYLLMSKIKGKMSCTDEYMENPKLLVSILAQSLKRLWEIDIAECPVRRELNKPGEELVFSHGDFCMPNIFIQNGELAGYIDLGRSGVADKWQDIALCYRSLKDNFSGKYATKIYEEFDPNLLFEELGVEPDWNKINYYMLLDELL